MPSVASFCLRETWDTIRTKKRAAQYASTAEEKNPYLLLLFSCLVEIIKTANNKRDTTIMGIESDMNELIKFLLVPILKYSSGEPLNLSFSIPKFAL